MSELLKKFRALRGKSASTSTVGSKTKQPIYEAAEQKQLMAHIKRTQPEWLALFWQISVATGWRTSDVCRLSYSNIDWNDGTATIRVSKQTLSAESRAYRKGLLVVKETRKREALLNNDPSTYMRLDAAPVESFADGLTAEEDAMIAELVAAAPVKTDRKKLPAALLAKLKERKARNFADDFVFSRSQTESNRSKWQEGCVTRQAVWKRLTAVFAWFAKEVNAKLKLSAYSARKCFAYAMYQAAEKAGQSGLMAACTALGHGSPEVTRRYLGLSSIVENLQAKMAEAIAA